MEAAEPRSHTLREPQRRSNRRKPGPPFASSNSPKRKRVMSAAARAKIAASARARRAKAKKSGKNSLAA